MIKLHRYLMILVLWFAGIGADPCNADPLAITPFYTYNQSPLTQIYGFPAAESAIIQPPGHTWSLLALDVANNFDTRSTNREKIFLDGESTRVTLALRYGLTDQLEVGVDLPWVGYSGGLFDSFIEEFHHLLDLPHGGRPKAPRDRLLFAYEKDGLERLRMDDASFGVGDVRLTGGWQLYHDGNANPCAVALRASLKLPTGSTAKLRGSGSTDIALWLSGSDDYLLPGSWGHMTLLLAAGGMAMTDGEVLKDQQANLAGFGSLGLGWSPADWIALKAQFSAHSRLYQGSNLGELSRPAVLIILGGTYAFTPKTALDIALTEDASLAASPDVALHLGLSHQF